MNEYTKTLEELDKIIEELRSIPTTKTLSIEFRVYRVKKFLIKEKLVFDKGGNW